MFWGMRIFIFGFARCGDMFVWLVDLNVSCRRQLIFLDIRKVCVDNDFGGRRIVSVKGGRSYTGTNFWVSVFLCFSSIACRLGSCGCYAGSTNSS